MVFIRAKKKSIFILDNLKAVQTENVFNEAKKLDITMFFLPSNTTPISQPLDHHIIRQVKRGVCCLYNNWRKKKTPRFKQPMYIWINQCVQWVCEAWDKKVSKRMIKKAFKETLAL